MLLGALRAKSFVRTTAALYRDGDDSVAFHGDTTARDLLQATVATVSLGAARKFLVKPTEGGKSQAYALGGGDLVVMGGTCQRTWRHAIPKVTADVGPRIAGCCSRAELRQIERASDAFGLAQRCEGRPSSYSELLVIAAWCSFGDARCRQPMASARSRAPC